jgi:hypothetical protein
MFSGGSLHVLVDQSALVEPTERPHDRDGQAQEAPELHGPAEKALQRRAVRIIEHQRCLAAFANELERLHGPGGVKLIF